MAAPSLWLRYHDNIDGSSLTQDVLVPASGLTTYTYYSALNWNAGRQGGGYCGMQDSPYGKNFIFSIWDPIGTHQAIKASYVGPGTQISHFGGEGTGLKSVNYSLGWHTDRWYTLLARRWDTNNNHTAFGFWVTDKTTGKSTHLVTMDFPVAHVYFSGGTGSFIEDWNRTGSRVRSVMYGNGAKLGLNNKWTYFTHPTFIVNASSSGTYAHAYNAELRSGAIYMQSGGSTVPRNGVHSGTEFHRSKKRLADELVDNVFTLSDVKQNAVTWDFPETNTPQFRYTVIADGVPIVSEVDSEVRHYQLQTPANRYIEVVIEDVLGRVSSQRHLFSHM